MKKVSSSTLATLIVERTDRTSGPILLHDRIAQLAADEGYAANFDEALELVEPLLAEIRVKTAQFQRAAERDGTTWNVELFGSDDEWIRGSSFSDASLDPVTRRLRASRAYVSDVRAEIVNLTPNEFECACTTILKLVGCVEPHTSPITDDGGIDFYGRLSLKGRLDMPLPLGGLDDRASVWLIGQAKHYKTTTIQTAALRELVGSVELARTGGAIHSWHGLTLRPFDAVLILIFSTGTFSSGAQRLLTQSGMLAMNGEQLATLLCDVGLGFTGDPPKFDPEEFRRGLLKHE